MAVSTQEVIVVNPAATSVVTVSGTAVGPQGATGLQGPKGDTGSTGAGVPAGGTAGQVLSKKTTLTDYDTQWINPNTNAGTVTSITATAPLTGGTITSTGTIGLDQTALAITPTQVTGTAAVLNVANTFTGTVTAPTLTATTVNATTVNATNVGISGARVNSIYSTSINTTNITANNIFLGTVWGFGNNASIYGFSATYPLVAQSNNIITVPFSIRQYTSSQTGNLQEWSSTTGAALSSIGPQGAFTAPAVTATTVTATTVNATTANVSATGTFNALVATTITGTTHVGTTATFTGQGTFNTAGATTVNATTVNATTVTATTVNATRMSVTTTATQANDVTNKAYVDAAAQGLNVHPYCRAASTVAITGTATAGTSDQSQGTGIGATFVYATASYPTIDSVTLVLNDRVLLKNQTDAKQNGIYYVSATGTNNTLTRATDADNSIAGQVAAGDFVFIDEGGQNNTGWVVDAAGTATTPPKGIRIGTDNISFTQFSGAGTYTAGVGITQSGSSFLITSSAGTLNPTSGNLDLTAVTRTNTTGATSSTTIQSITTDTYGRVTAVTSGTHTLASTSVAGIASFNNTNFSVTSGAVAANAITLTAGSGITLSTTAVNLGSSVTITNAGVISFAGATGEVTVATSNGATVTTTGSQINVGLTQNLQSAGTPTFAGLTISSGGTATTPTLVATTGTFSGTVSASTVSATTATIGSGGITSSGQVAVSTSSTSAPQLTVQPTGSFTKSVTSGTLISSISVSLNISNTAGLWAGQSITGSGFANTTLNNTYTISSIVANTSITVQTTVPTFSGTIATGTITASGTPVNVQEWQSSTGTAVASINGSGDFASTGRINLTGSSVSSTLTATSLAVASVAGSTTVTPGSIVMTGSGSGINAGSNNIQTTGTITGSGANITNLAGANITAATIPQSAMVNTKTLNRLTSSATSSTTVGTYTNIFSTGSYTMTADTTYAVKMFVLYQRSASTSIANTLQVKFTLSNTHQSVALGNITEAGASISSASIGYYSSGTSVLVGTATSTNGNPFIGIIEGYIRTNATTGGTITPQFTMSAGNGTTDTITILAGTYVELTNLGTGAPALPYGSTGWA